MTSEVTQADREAAAREGLNLSRLNERDADALRQGGGWDEWSLVQAFARHRAEALTAWNARTVQAELVEALQACLTFLNSAPLESGYCCCGDAVDAHNMGSGHAPVDDLAHYAGQVAERARAAITRATGAAS